MYCSTVLYRCFGCWFLWNLAYLTRFALFGNDISSVLWQNDHVYQNRKKKMRFLPFSTHNPANCFWDPLNDAFFLSCFVPNWARKISDHASPVALWAYDFLHCYEWMKVCFCKALSCNSKVVQIVSKGEFCDVPCSLYRVTLVREATIFRVNALNCSWKHDHPSVFGSSCLLCSSTLFFRDCKLVCNFFSTCLFLLA